MYGTMLGTLLKVSAESFKVGFNKKHRAETVRTALCSSAVASFFRLLLRCKRLQSGLICEVSGMDTFNSIHFNETF